MELQPKEVKAQNLFKKGSKRKSKDKRGHKNKDAGDFLALIPVATTNKKHSTTSSQINKKSHINGLFTSFPLTQYLMPGFQQKNYKVC